MYRYFKEYFAKAYMGIEKKDQFLFAKRQIFSHARLLYIDIKREKGVKTKRMKKYRRYL